MISLISPSKLLQDFVEGYLILEGSAKQIFGGNDYTVDFSETAGFFFNYGDNCYKYNAHQKKEKLPKNGVHGVYTKQFSYHFEDNVKLIFVILRPDTELDNLQISAKKLINSYATIGEAFGATFKIIEDKICECTSLEERLSVIEKILFETINSTSKKNINKELICTLLQKVCPIQKAMC